MATRPDLDGAPAPAVPPYGTGSLSDLTPSLLAAAGVAGEPNVLGLEPCRGFCLLVIDGLGWEQVLAHREVASFLASHADRGRPIAAGFPSTTSVSLASLGTGLPPGEHGLVGYTMAVPGFDRPMNTLLWELYGIGPRVHLADRLVPERLQPASTVLERAEAAGMGVVQVGPPPNEGSPLSRALFRGGSFRGAYWPEDVKAVVSEVLRHVDRPAVYAYHPDLDAAGHMQGVGSDAWLEHLGRVDRLVEDIGSTLSEDVALVVTGDHGMVNVGGDDRLDVADLPELMTGVRMLAGEARARHVHAQPEAAADVLALWRDVLGDRMWIVSGEESIEAGWFGPRVLDTVRPRIGDVVAAARGPVGIVQRDVDPVHASLVSHHGSMTAAEQLVPLIVVRA